MLDELHQPFVVQGIEEPTDVCVEHPVHLSLRDAHPERVQRIMLAASWAEAVREAEEVLLVDVIQDRHHGLLDDLVFERRDAQRTHAPVGLGYV